MQMKQQAAHNNNLMHDRLNTVICRLSNEAVHLKTHVGSKAHHWHAQQLQYADAGSVVLLQVLH